MIAYCTATGTRTSIARIKAAGWRFMLTLDNQHPKGLPYAVDNGAWTAFNKGEAWDEDRFLGLVKKRGTGADWIVAPDIVAGGLESLALSASWLDTLLAHAPVLIAVQDGMKPHHLGQLIGSSVGIFVGGSTEWKLATMPAWAAHARERDALCHVGRVNSVKRINLCHSAGATSFDGTCVTRFVHHIGRLDAARRQTTMFDQLRGK